MLRQYDLDAPALTLLTTGNPKTAKGEGLGYLTAILHLAPASLSGRNVCPHSTAGCRAACLNTAGRGGIGLDSDGLNTIQAARIRRTRYLQRDRAGFLAQLAHELRGHVRTAQRHGLKPAVRLNGTSDLPWERWGVMAEFPEVRFYDYTKWPLDKRRASAAYRLTFSLSEHRDSDARAAAYLDAGQNVAAVFSTRKGQPLPSFWALAGGIYPVIDGDLRDLRFLDQPGAIVGLRAKGRAKQDDSGFVRAV